jgi:hypothetical protein
MPTSVSARSRCGRRAETQLDDAFGDVLGDVVDDAVGELGDPLTGGALLDGGVGSTEDGGVGASDDGTPATTRTTRWNVVDAPALFVHFTSNTIWSAGPVAVIASENCALWPGFSAPTSHTSPPLTDLQLGVKPLNSNPVSLPAAIA